MIKRITIKDIAKLSGCSVNCVSRALMDAPDISLKTKEKIKRIADETGYVYNRSAAALRAGKSHAIGILFDNLLNPFYYIMINYIWAYLHAEGYSIITFKNDIDVFGKDMLKQILTYNVDGLLSFLAPDKEAVKILESSGIPAVVLGRNTSGMCDCVFIDDRKGGRLAARSFIERGFKRPMYIGELSSLECSVERGEGFREEFEKAGIKADLRYLDDFDSAKFGNFFAGLADRNELPDCVFCFNDFAAYEIMAVMDGRGIKDVAVIGYDNIGKEINMPGMLASVDYDKRSMTDTAVNILLNKINGVADGHSPVTVAENLKVSFVKPVR